MAEDVRDQLLVLGRGVPVDHRLVIREADDCPEVRTVALRSWSRSSRSLNGDRADAVAVAVAVAQLLAREHHLWADRHIGEEEEMRRVPRGYAGCGADRAHGGPRPVCSADVAAGGSR